MGLQRLHEVSEKTQYIEIWLGHLKVRFSRFFPLFLHPTNASRLGKVVFLLFAAVYDLSNFCLYFWCQGC